VSKTHDRVLPADTALADRVNMIYTGTAVAGGIGRAVVVATGVSTELGRVGTLVAGVTLEKTPLERKLERSAGAWSGSRSRSPRSSRCSASRRACRSTP
jgi:Ca2+-transporting ATPase